jgi:diaminohydroxyphosphoribosylaminopyrimidine deaminase/5-amino-6-(5-phosphoribosylamino)uracil reductase
MSPSYFSDPPDPVVETYWDVILDALYNGASEMPAPPEALIGFADLYRPFFRADKKPLVVAQLGQSLDGFVATESGASHYITGPESLVHLHRLRALCDAVVVGANTVEADNPRLTVRRVAGTSPLRVILDPKGRVSSDRAIFAEDGAGCLRITQDEAETTSAGEQVTIPKDEDFAKNALGALFARGCRRILIEGGGITVSRMIEDGLIDRLHLMIAPLIVGRGRRGLGLPPCTDLSKALRPSSRQMQVGNDVLFDLDMR